jgi:hypothetical protein
MWVRGLRADDVDTTGPVDDAATMTPSSTVAADRAATPSSTRSATYFAGPFVDAMFLGGFSILFFVYIRFGIVFLDHNSGAEDATFLGNSAARWALMAFWILNWPHFAATSYRLYRSRETTSQFPITAWVVPVVVGLGVVGSLASPSGFAPWFVKAFFIWSPYHFSGQTIGLTLLYARRSGFEVTPLLRSSLTWFVYATCLEFQARIEIPGVDLTFFDVVMPSIGLPLWVLTVTNWAVIGLGCVLAVALIDALRRSAVPMPVIFLVPALAQLVWFNLSVGTWRTDSYFEFVNLFHSVQYLFIAWFLQMRERQIRTGRQGSWLMLARESAVWGLGIFLIGAFMFRWSGQLISSVTAVSFGVAIAVMTAAFQLHHFFVDGVIWKLRDPKVRGALSTTLGELTGRRSAGSVG